MCFWLLPLLQLGLVVWAGPFNQGVDVRPNAPAAGWTELFSDDFEAGDLTRANEHFRWGERSGTRGDEQWKPVVTDAIARSGRLSLRCSFIGRGGNTTADADSWCEQRFALGVEYREVMLTWWQYFPRGNESPGVGSRFEHRLVQGPSNNKWLMLWSRDYSDYGLLTGWLTEGKRADPHVIANRGWKGGGGSGVQGTGAWCCLDDAMRGRWVKVTLHARASSAAGSPDGLYELGFDDVTRIHWSGVWWPRDGRNAGFQYGYLFGWANGGFTNATSVYVDDFSVSVPGD
jgi:hypothetical protein